MKKFIAAYFIVITILGYMYISVDAKDAKSQKELVVIPEDAIRLRILANSDTRNDQFVKSQISSKVNDHIASWGEMEDRGSARKEIKKRLHELEQVVEVELDQLDVKTTFTVEFKKVEFPTKMYGNFLYPAGYYEAILITLGEGLGNNWWCVLYPQVCFVNESDNKFGTSNVFAKEVEAANHAVIEENEEMLDKEKSELVEEQPVILEEEKTEEIEVRFFLLDLFF